MTFSEKLRLEPIRHSPDHNAVPIPQAQAAKLGENAGTEWPEFGFDSPRHASHSLAGSPLARSLEEPSRIGRRGLPAKTQIHLRRITIEYCHQKMDLSGEAGPFFEVVQQTLGLTAAERAETSKTCQKFGITHKSHSVAPGNLVLLDEVLGAVRVYDEPLSGHKKRSLTFMIQIFHAEAPRLHALRLQQHFLSEAVQRREVEVEKFINTKLATKSFTYKAAFMRSDPELNRLKEKLGAANHEWKQAGMPISTAPVAKPNNELTKQLLASEDKSHLPAETQTHLRQTVIKSCRDTLDLSGSVRGFFSEIVKNALGLTYGEYSATAALCVKYGVMRGGEYNSAPGNLTCLNPVLDAVRVDEKPLSEEKKRSLTFMIQTFHAEAPVLHRLRLQQHFPK